MTREFAVARIEYYETIGERALADMFRAALRLLDLEREIKTLDF